MTFSDSDVITDWPTLDELKQWVNVPDSEWDGSADLSRFTRALSAAINYVKKDVGDWDELTDLPDEDLAEAAMTAAIKFAVLKKQEAAIEAIRSDPVYNAAMKGHRRRFGIA